MEILISTQLSRIEIKVTAVRDDKPVRDIVGFFELVIFDGENKPYIKVRGGTIKVKQFDRKDPVFTVNAPAYKSAYKYRTSFVFEDTKLWREVERSIIKELAQQNGGLSPIDLMPGHVNPDDIPY